ncbi:MAG TPA: UPF0182 family protein [Firmicutes bacterium]|nr:UPF0182 family protein [Bacillota bacterium]
MRFRQILLGIVIVVVIGIFAFSGKYVDWLWFKTLGSTSVFWVTLITGPLIKLILCLLVFGFFIANFLISIRAFNRIKAVDSFWANVSESAIMIPGIIISALLAILLSFSLSLDWTVIQQFFNQVTVGIKDPIFSRDLGYYFFSFPFYQQLNNLLQTITFLALVGIAIVYFLAKAFWQQGTSWELWLPAKVHLTILTVFFLLSKIWSYHLGKFGLLFQETARITGLNYTSVHAKILSYNVLTVLLIAIIILVLFNITRRTAKILIGSLVVWIACSIVLGMIYPGIIQSFVVAPNEYELESAYLKNHIEFTRQAYNLDKIEVKDFNPADNKAFINNNDPALSDLRLWDHTPLKPSYNQLQSIRPYYNFNDIDIDRYPSRTGQHQVMIAARELNTDRLADQAQTWINLHLTYTHGYGISANQVNQFSSQGQPIFIARDLPPKSDPEFPALKVTNPGIYYGETTDNYVIVNTETPEFDFPEVNQNRSTFYKGPQGIMLNSPFRKLLMALNFKETNFMLSSQLTPQSSILLHRNIKDRIQKLAPFLSFDDDPYLVVSGGKLYWIIDAYTSSSYYPYAKYHESGVNYIRNSVKAVVDAYTGEVGFYVIDNVDPIIKVWQKVFPYLFKPVTSLSPDLIRHFRYPEYLLSIQRDMLLQYHMTNVKTFYEKEDYWDVPVHNQDEVLDPYYVTLKLPQEKSAEFVMMQPFCPRAKPNLASWLVARCDGANYGKLILYNLPKDVNIYGPAQIDSRINQDQTISQLITLWNQQQSRVVWGNLLIVPIEDSILYAKPLYIESELNKQAELKKIVMVYNNQVLIGDSVTDALSKISLNPTTDSDSSVDLNAIRGVNDKRKAEIIQRLDSLVREQQRLIQELQGL